jgi:chorismate dehydratase
MNSIKISLVSYLNSKPFLYGFDHFKFQTDIDLVLDIPSVCAQKLMNGKADLGLVPVAILPEMKECHIISEYCIGAEGKVGSVILYSQVPLNEIKNILLDYQSETSIVLVRILAKYFWKIDPQWTKATINYENKVSADTAAVIIGDRAFGIEEQYTYSYDLAEEWQKFTQLPFVFACWVANKKLPESFLKEFNQALKYGLDNRPSLVNELIKNNDFPFDVATYLTENIKYDFDSAKKKALDLFLNYMSTLKKLNN